MSLVPVKVENDTMNSTILAQRILLERRSLNWNQDELASRAGISRSYVSHLERAQIPNPTMDVVEALASALGVQPDYLIGWSDDPAGEDRPPNVAEGRLVYQVSGPLEYRLAQQLLDLFNEMTPEDQRILIEVAQRIARAGNVRIIGE